MLRGSIQCSKVEQHDLITMAVTRWMWNMVSDFDGVHFGKRVNSMLPNWATGSHHNVSDEMNEQANGDVFAISHWRIRGMRSLILMECTLVGGAINPVLPKTSNTVSQWQRRYELWGGQWWTGLIHYCRIEQQDFNHNGSHDEVNERGTTHVYTLAQ